MMKETRIGTNNLMGSFDKVGRMQVAKRELVSVFSFYTFDFVQEENKFIHSLNFVHRITFSLSCLCAFCAQVVYLYPFWVLIPGC